MPPQARLNDMCTGHSCWPSSPIVEASENVIVNKKGAARIGDKVATHCCLIFCHGRAIAKGSNTVYINSRKAARLGDNISCGGKIAEGSDNVYTN